MERNYFWEKCGEGNEAPDSIAMKTLFTVILLTSFTSVFGQVKIIVPQDSVFIYGPPGNGVINNIKLGGDTSICKDITLTFDLGTISSIGNCSYHIWGGKIGAGYIKAIYKDMMIDSVKVKVEEEYHTLYLASNNKLIPSGSTIDKQTLISCDSIILKCIRCDPYIQSFIFEVGGKRPVKNIGSKFNSRTKRMINKCKSGDKIFLYAINILGYYDWFFRMNFEIK
jgi:hypothetical protein